MFVALGFLEDAFLGVELVPDVGGFADIDEFVESFVRLEEDHDAVGDFFYNLGEGNAQRLKHWLFVIIMIVVKTQLRPLNCTINRNAHSQRKNFHLLRRDHMLPHELERLFELQPRFLRKILKWCQSPTSSYNGQGQLWLYLLAGKLCTTASESDGFFFAVFDYYVEEVVLGNLLVRF